MARDSTYFERLPAVRSDEFLPVIGPWLRAGGVVLVATVGSMMALAATLRYTPVIEADGVLKHAGDRYEVQAPVDGAVSQIKIQPNQTVHQAVHQGETIALLDPTGPTLAVPILAPVSGVLLELNVSHSQQMVRAGDAIATITPTLAPLTLTAQVSPAEIGKIIPCHEPVMTDCKVGRALVSIASFSQHKPILSVVREISPDTIAQSETTDEFFEVTLELPSEQVLPASMPLRAGMSVQVEMLSKPTTLLSVFRNTQT